MTILDAVILGIVEGITEFLPISSTGHLILTSSLLGIAGSDFLKTFEIAIQLGAIFAAVVLYFKSFFDFEIVKRVVVAFIPTGIVGLLFYQIIKTYLLGSETVVVWSLLLGGIALIIFELWHAGRESSVDEVRHISYTHAAIIGLFQSIAIIPGVSRSAATIVGGLLLGIRRIAIVEFSFLLAVPTMAAATGLDLLKNASAFSSNDMLILAVGFVVSFLVALAAIKFLLAFVRTRTFISFGVYRIVLALLFLVVIAN